MVNIKRLAGYERPKVLAHRMLVMMYPENTILSLNAAIEQGVDWIEFDVKVLADGEMISFHDSTVDRTTDGQGSVEKMTLKEVRALNAGKNYDYGFVPIPTVEEILKVLATTGKNVKAEMHIHNLWEPERLVTLLDKYGLRDRCYFNLGIIPVAEHMREDNEDHESLISLNAGGITPEMKEISLRLDLDYLCVPPRYLTAENVDEVHHYREDNPVFVHCYPVQTEEDWQHMYEIGVDVIQTDYPAALMGYLDEKGI